MTAHPEPPELDIVALVRRDVARAVRDAADHTDSPFLAHGRLDVTLDPLRQRLALLARRRPDLHAELAEHFDVSTSPDDVAAAVAGYAHRLLERRLERTARTTGPDVADPTLMSDVLRVRAVAHRRDPPRPAPPRQLTPPRGRSRDRARPLTP